MKELTMWIIRRICSDIVNVFAARGPISSGAVPFAVSVNLSAVQLQDRKALEAIDLVIKRNAISSDCIKFEITEHTLIADPRLACDGLMFLRGCGYRISLDDFGTGYSSLSYLHRFPIDEIKLDGSFISEVEHNEASQTVVKGVVDLAHALGLTVVGEGVETQAQLDFLSDIGCDCWQGFLRSAGVHPKEFLFIQQASDITLKENSYSRVDPAENTGLPDATAGTMV